jgi:hypothetical protein
MISSLCGLLAGDWIGGMHNVGIKTGKRKWDLQAQLIEVLNSITEATIAAMRANSSEPLWLTKMVRTLCDARATC